MNLMADFIHSLIAGAEQRMDTAGAPQIVRERCPYCEGTRYRFNSPCTACAATGSITVERINAER